MMPFWKNIPSEPGYQVTPCGRVRSTERRVATTRGLRRYKGRELKPAACKSGHMTVCCGKFNTRYVHDLVLETFVGPRPEGMEALHRDDDKTCNEVHNLRWGTRSENLKMAYANGCR